MEGLLRWAQRNERHLGGALFVGGFITDLLTFTLLDVSFVNLFFVGYLALAALATLGSHILFARKHEGQSKVEQAFAVIFSLVAQYAIGGILSGCLIFYTKSSVLTVSWPFLILLALVFIGNEFFRKYREHLTYQTVLLFFALYAYAIFALPIYTRTIGPWVFVGSSAITIGLFGGYLYLLSRVGKSRLHESFRAIIVSCVAIVAVLNAAYFTGLVPPIPLTLREAGIYHSLRHENGTYVVTAEDPQPWWDIRPDTVHLTAGESAYAYASVFAPVRFSTSVVHHWERYDEKLGKWTNQGHIAFPIAGGRGGGYRGYSVQENPVPGRWRLSVETLAGQTIGRVYFSVERVQEKVPLHEETH